MSLRASIDIGSNSVLLLIGRVNGDNIEVVEKKAHVTGLGKDLDRYGVFSSEPMQDTLQVLDSYKEICEKHGLLASDVVVTATEASRVAKNSFDFYQEVAQKTGLKTTIITGEAEAYYSMLGVLIDSQMNEH